MGLNFQNTGCKYFLFGSASLTAEAQSKKGYKFCFTVHFNSLNVTHQLMHFQYNNILV